MDLFRAIYNRRAVRDYLPQPIERGDIRRLIDAAIQAPSAINEQPWRFTVVLDQCTLNALSAECKTYMLANQPAPFASHHFEMLRDPSYHIFHHAPALIIISASSAAPCYVEDCALAAENLMLAAYAEGLGSCWIGFAQAYLNTAEGRQLLGLPADSATVAPIIVGKPCMQPPFVTRREPSIQWIGQTQVLGWLRRDAPILDLLQ
jgi:nitroreductase